MSDPEIRTTSPDAKTPSGWSRSAPVAALLLLSPIIAEVLFGVTRISIIFLLIIQVGTWGCAALIIREMVRRRHRGWGAMLLLGLALAVAEECVIQQTSLAPLVGIEPDHAYGRAFGVNWPYFLWALGYESIWVVLLPVQLVELLFPARRDEPWLGKTGLIISATVFVLASFVAWYSWTQLYLPSLPSHSAYKVPLSSVLIALTAIVLLTAAALGPKRSSRTDTAKTGTVPPPILVGLAAFGLAVPWFALIFLAYGSMPTLPVAVPMIGGLALAGFAFVLIARWSRSPAWRDSSRLALIFGATLASMLAGFRIYAVGGGAPYRRHRQTRFERDRGRVADPPCLESLERFTIELRTRIILARLRQRGSDAFSLAGASG